MRIIAVWQFPLPAGLLMGRLKSSECLKSRNAIMNDFSCKIYSQIFVDSPHLLSSLFTILIFLLGTCPLPYGYWLGCSAPMLLAHRKLATNLIGDM